MKKKILIGLGLVVVILAILAFWQLKSTKKHSPVATASYSANGLNIDVIYCRPYKKGRVIFGEESSGALQPYGKYWRVGANEATTFEINKDIIVNGQELKAGKYQLYAVPGKDQWSIYFNSDWDKWGYSEADHEKDVLKTDVLADNNAPLEEQLVISFEGGDSVGTTSMAIHWDQTRVEVPIAVK